MAALVELRFRESTTARTDAFQTLAHDLAMHIVAMRPRVVKPSQLDAAAWAEHLGSLSNRLHPLTHQQRIPHLEEARTAFERAHCLLKQAFVKGNGDTVEEHLAAVSSRLSEQIEIVRFVWLEAGKQPIESNHDD